LPYRAFLGAIVARIAVTPPTGGLREENGKQQVISFPDEKQRVGDGKGLAHPLLFIISSPAVAVA
jgi:hypothetical protein